MAKRQPDKRMIRSSAAEYLTFVAASGQGGVETVYAEENIWLSQKMMAQLYDTAEIARTHAESEFEKYRIVQDRLFESDFDRVPKLQATDKGEES